MYDMKRIVIVFFTLIGIGGFLYSLFAPVRFYTSCSMVKAGSVELVVYLNGDVFTRETHEKSKYLIQSPNETHLIRSNPFSSILIEVIVTDAHGKFITRKDTMIRTVFLKNIDINYSNNEEVANEIFIKKSIIGPYN